MHLVVSKILSLKSCVNLNMVTIKTNNLSDAIIPRHHICAILNGGKYIVGNLRQIALPLIFPWVCILMSRNFIAIISHEFRNF